MKITKTASGDRVTLSKKEWLSIGKTAGWGGVDDKFFDRHGNPLKSVHDQNDYVKALDELISLFNKGSIDQSKFEKLKENIANQKNFNSRKSKDPRNWDLLPLE